jgi:hypothetical protein
MQIASSSYPEWALRCYHERIHSPLHDFNRPILGNVASDIWLNCCDPGPSPLTQYRLFPGALFLLWIEALAAPTASVGAEPVAAALECLHNASLIHDDILDGHAKRRAQLTLLARTRVSGALLGGDSLCATAMRLLGRIADPRIGGCLDRLGAAFEDMVAGQLLDEPDVWAKVPLDDRESHWRMVCAGKLALGNVAAPLAAYWIGRTELEQELALMMAEFSVVSQIINDWGDALGWSGYHVLSPSDRPRDQEAVRKPLFSSLAGLSLSGRSDSAVASAVWERAHGEIRRLQNLTLARLKRLAIHPDRQETLVDFFTRPVLPQRNVTD